VELSALVARFPRPPWWHQFWWQQGALIIGGLVATTLGARLRAEGRPRGPPRIPTTHTTRAEDPAELVKRVEAALRQEQAQSGQLTS
jgi:hypothetical protein